MDSNKIEFYKKYRNKVTHIKFLAKQQYYDQVLQQNKSNPKKMWSVIRKMVDYKKNSQTNNNFMHYRSHLLHYTATIFLEIM